MIVDLEIKDAEQRNTRNFQKFTQEPDITLIFVLWGSFLMGNWSSDLPR